MIFPEGEDGACARTRVKICGITHPDDAVLALEAGADALGLNFYPRSLRYLDLARDGGWLRRLPADVPRVGVVVNASREEIVRLLGEGIVDAVQLHGDEDEAFCLALRNEGIPSIKAFRPRGEPEIARVEGFGAEAVLIDAYHPQAYGGTGQVVDWSAAARLAVRHRRMILAGGLHPGNVAEAIRIVRPYAVDVASGVERETDARRKDAVKLREFFAAVRAADTENTTAE